MDDMGKIYPEVSSATDFRKWKESCFLFCSRHFRVTDTAIAGEVIHRGFGEIVATDTREMPRRSLNVDLAFGNRVARYAFECSMLFVLMREAGLFPTRLRLI